MRRIFPLAAAFLLAGCAGSSIGSLTGGSASTSPRPKSIVVTDFQFSPDVSAVDRGYTTRLERKIGGFPTFERKPRTLERVNEEIVASTVATLRAAGFEAQPGGPDGVASDGSVIVTASLRATEPVAVTNKPKLVSDQVGFGTGKTNVVADVKVLSSGKRQLTAFDADSGGARGAAGNAKQASAQNAVIASVLAEQNAAPEKLSPDVEAQARRLGRSVAEKVLAFGKEQGWLEGAPVVETPPAEEKPAKLPAAKPPKPAAKKPAAPAVPAAPAADDAEPPKE